jgi:hypothetical protein
MAGAKTKYTSQYIDNWSFDESYNESTVLPVKEDPNGTLVRTVSGDLAVQWAVDSVHSNIFYVGEATPGSIANSDVWRIFAVDSTNGTLQYADGDTSFNNNFSNREALSYS